MGVRARENLEDLRRLTYEALLMQANGRWATIEEIGEVAEQQDMGGVLDGLVHLRELEVTIFDDGLVCYRLTDFGRLCATGVIASSRPKSASSVFSLT